MVILTAEQHAAVRAALQCVMEYAAFVRDSRSVDPADANAAAMAAAEALDLLDAAALTTWGLATLPDVVLH